MLDMDEVQYTVAKTSGRGIGEVYGEINDGEVMSYSFKVNCTPCEHRNSMDILNRFAGNIIGNHDERFRDLHIVSLFDILDPSSIPDG